MPGRLLKRHGVSALIDFTRIDDEGAVAQRCAAGTRGIRRFRTPIGLIMES